MIEVHRWKILGDGKKVSLYKNEKQMRKGMEICLKSIRTIRELLYELEFEEYVENDGIQDRCSMHFQIIGNQMGLLDDPLLSNSAMKTAYGARNIIAHVYGTDDFDKVTHWRYLHDDLDFLEKGCLQVLEMLDAKKIIISENRKNALPAPLPISEPIYS